MNRIRTYLSDKELIHLENTYSNITTGVREAVRKLQEYNTVDELENELSSINKLMKKLIHELELKTNQVTVEEYISYLHYYSSNRGFHLPNRTEYFTQGGKRILEEEKELHHAMRKNEAYLYKERKIGELRYGLDLEKYHHAKTEDDDTKYKLDLVVFSYDYRSVFIFLTNDDKGKRIKLRTMKKHFINTLRFIKPSTSIYLSTRKNERGYLEIVDLREGENE